MSARRRFVLLDRDGTVIVERNYLSDARQVELLPNAAAGLKRMAGLGFGLVILTNQSGLGRGYFDRATLDAIHDRMRELLEAEGVRLDGVYVCPHTPDDACDCRKPKRGLVDQAAADLGFDPMDSVVIGDKHCDIELGAGVGAYSILVRTGYGATTEASGTVAPDLIVDGLVDAALAIETLEPSA